jgi:AcrR family transcriptional regulator
VRAAQRDRLLRAVVAACAESGYAAVTVAGIVRRAKVSRAAFYDHFPGKDECFLAAAAEGGQLLAGRVVTAGRSVNKEASAEDALRAGCRAYLGFLAGEPAFARVFYVDMPAAGPAAVGRLHAAAERFAEINRKWHERARVTHPEWPAVPGDAYLALAGATAELVRSRPRRPPLGFRLTSPEGAAGASQGQDVRDHLVCPSRRSWCNSVVEKADHPRGAAMVADAA